MITGDFEQFGEGLTTLAEVFDKPITPALIQIYFAALVDLDVQAVTAAMMTAAGSLKFFPKPVELRELIEGTAQDRGQMAWQTLTAAIRRFGTYTSVRFTDPAISDAILETFGGWQEACTTLPPSDDPMHANFRKRFEVAYELARKRDLHRSSYLPGMAEAQNRNSGLLGREYSLPVGIVESDQAMREIRARFDAYGQMLPDSRAALGLTSGDVAEADNDAMKSITGIAQRALRLIGGKEAA